VDEGASVSLRLLDAPEARQSRAIQSGGLSGHTLVTDARTGFGHNPTRFTVFFKDDRAFLLVATVKEAGEFARYDEQFRRTADSFRSMSRAEHERAQPYRIALYTVRRGDSYAGLAGRSPLPDYPEQWLRLINGQYPDGRLTPGRQIKIVQ
jgi:predicted Zn-dependent protease